MAGTGAVVTDWHCEGLELSRFVIEEVRMTVVGLLQPGVMGAAIGAELTQAGHQVLRVSSGRSAATAARARAAGLDDVGDMPQFLAQAKGDRRRLPVAGCRRTCTGGGCSRTTPRPARRSALPRTGRAVLMHSACSGSCDSDARSVWSPAAKDGSGLCTDQALASDLASRMPAPSRA